MKRFLTLLFLPLIAFVLFACGEDDIIQEQVPEFSHLIVEERSPMTDGTVDPYVRDKEDTIRVEIHFNNPANHPINSVVINGQRYYAVNRFVEGSNPQVAILELTLRLPGETTYEVQSFVYSEVNSVDVTGNNFFDVFVLKTLPTATLTNLTPGTESLSMDIRINDPDQVVLADTSEARLYLGSELVATRTLIRGIINNVVFDDLMSDQDYHLEVVTGYNRDDGQGNVLEYQLLERDDLSTQPKQAPSASITVDEVTAEDVLFHVDITDQFNVIDIESVYMVLMLGTTEYARIDGLHDLSDLENLVFDGLLSNNNYSIEIYASFDLNDETGVREDVLLTSQAFQTLERPAPTLTANLLSVTESSLILAIDGTMVDDTVDLASLKAYIYDDATNDLLTIAHLVDGQLTFAVDGLLAHTRVRIEVEAIVDFQDGETPDYAVIFTDTYETAQNQSPSGNISNLTFTQNTASFTVSITNTNNTIVPGSVIANLYENDVLIKTISIPTASGTYTFEDVDIHHENSYAVNVKVDYNLRDGGATIEDYRLSTFVRNNLQPKAPIATLDAIEEVSEGLRVNYTVLDNDSTIIEDGLELLINDTVIILDPEENDIIIENYLHNTQYEISLRATYVTITTNTTVLDEETFTTSTLRLPTAIIDSITHDLESITVDVTIEDLDEVITNGLDVVLYEGDVLVERISVTESGSVTFTNVSQSTDYTVVLEATLDLRDGEGEHTATLYTTNTTTPRYLPTVSITSPVIGQESMNGRFTVNDPYALIDEDTTLRIELLDQSLSLVGNSHHIEPNTRLFLYNLWSNYTYTVHVYAMIDGNETLVQEQTFTTAAKTAPSSSINTIAWNGDDLVVNIGSLSNPHDVTATFTLILYVDGEVEQTIPLTDGGDQTFENVLGLGQDYVVKLMVDYDLNDSLGLIEDVLLDVGSIVVADKLE